jgi:hypothetical protein
VRPEGLGELEKIHLIETRSRDLPACSLVPKTDKMTWNFKKDENHDSVDLKIEREFKGKYFEHVENFM